MNPDSLPNTLYTAAQVRELDRIAIEEFGIPGFELMSKAGRFCFHMLLKLWPETKKLVILCGGGNNAGDGYIIAGLALQRGLEADVWTAKDPASLRGDAKSAFDLAISKGLEAKPFEIADWQQAYREESESTILVDALLGTGLNSEVRGTFADMIKIGNESKWPCMAVDIPSGLNADTGEVMGLAIKADACTSFIGLKIGCFTNMGREYCGDIYFNGLDVPQETYTKFEPSVIKLEQQQLISTLPKRPMHAHKGHHGHLLLIGGDLGFGGAISLAATAAARMGAGLVSVATRPEHVSAIVSTQPEIMAHGIDEPKQISQLLKSCTSIVIGPGLGQSPWALELFHMALEAGKPLVIDADGLNLLALQLPDKELYRDDWLLTPHPGEAARLLGCENKDIQSSRIQAVMELQSKLGGTVLLKGSGSLIADSSNELCLCPYGNPGMGTGGMGDVLSGILGSLLAQGLEHNYAMKVGVSLHSLAADNLVASQGERGLLASDLIPEARRLLNKIET